MKKNIFLLAASLTALALATGCSESQLTNNDELPSGKAITINATTDDANSRITYDDDGTKIKCAWESTDALNIYQGTTWETANAFTVSSKTDDHNATFTGSLTTAPAEGEALNAIGKNTYSAVNLAQKDTRGMIFEYLTDQTGTLEDAEKHNILTGYTTYSANTTTKFTMGYKLAIIKFKLKLPADAGADVNTQIFLKATGNTTPALFLHYLNSGFTKKWYFDANYSTPIVTTVASGGVEKDVYMCVYPLASKALTAKILVGKSKLYTVSIGDKTPVAGKVYTKTLDLTSVTPENYILYQHFDKFIWGGDNSTNRGGVKPAAWASDNSKKEYYEYGSPVISAGGVTWGSDDFFTEMSDSYIASRDMTGWTGTNCNEHLGQLKLGAGKICGSVTTPAFTALTRTKDVIMTMKLIAWYENTTNVTPVQFSITGSGTLDVTTASLPTWKNNKWTTVTLNITGADATTKVTIAGTGNATDGTTRFIVDNIEVVEK